MTTTTLYPDRATFLADLSVLASEGYALEPGCYQNETNTGFRPQVLASRDGELFVLRWYAMTDEDVDHYSKRARVEANEQAQALIAAANEMSNNHAAAQLEQAIDAARNAVGKPWYLDAYAAAQKLLAAELERRLTGSDATREQAIQTLCEQYGVEYSAYDVWIVD